MEKDDKCRLCLSYLNIDDSSMFNIQQNDKNTDYHIPIKIMVCLSIPIQESNYLSNRICIPCKNEVIKFYEFRERCQSTYYTLLANVKCSKQSETHSTSPEDNNDDDNQSLQLHSTVEEPANESINLSKSTINIQDIGDDSKVIPQHPAFNNSTAIELPMQVKSIISSSSVALEMNNYNSEPTNYKCFYCKMSFADLSTASNHCLKCRNESTDVKLELKVDEESEKFVEQNKSSIEEVIIEKKENDENVAETNSSKDELIKCRKDCLHTKCRRSGLWKKTDYKCPECGKLFTSGCLLKRHLMVHTGEKPFECPICGRKFSQIGALNFHKKFHIKPPYSCKICNKPFMRPSDAEKHLRIHTGEKPYSCSICHKRFAQTTALQLHERIHTGVKPYVCEICGKAFSQSANKRKHVKIHQEGAKPHVCKICGRCFSDFKEMELHRAAHGGGKPRECDYCGLKFRKLSEISDHIRRLHTFEKPHQCAVCSKAFYNMYSLKQHIMVHTGQRPHPCSKCNLKFAQKGNLIKHYKRKHSDQYCPADESSEDTTNSDNEDVTDTELTKY